MARNEEKAQSMLYRFREAQAAELGLAQKGDKRPRMASACKSLRDCERWRGEILREISRKVSKIQDAGLTDYEVRDLNDEINRLMREKRHWENQIVALGGANYRRNVAMLDEDGKEVPGTREWEDSYQRLRTSLNLPSDTPVPKIPRPDPVPLSKIMAQLPQSGEDAAMTGTENDNADSANPSHPPMLSVLPPADLQHPKMPTKEEMEGVLLALRKRALLEQYLGDETPA
ncbi:NineTeen Complex (NTC) component [Ceratobasidium sp. 392]|nr:NineTeen Complex (NTC) component [Ceratobasidium sp. 392]